MEFQSALDDILEKLHIDLLNVQDEQTDRSVLVAYAAYCQTAEDRLQLQQLKDILATGSGLCQPLSQAYRVSKRENDPSFEALIKAVETLGNTWEKKGISCLIYAHFLSCVLFRMAQKDPLLGALGIEIASPLDPTGFDYTYRNLKSTFGFGRRRPSIKDFVIENCTLKAYRGSSPFVIIPSSVIAIDRAAFENNQTVTSVYIPRSVKRIGGGAFRNCPRLETVVIDAPIKRLPDRVFEGCSLLKRLDADSLTFVGKRCFAACKKLTAFLPTALTHAGEEAFDGCEALEQVPALPSLIRIGGRAFGGCALKEVTLKHCTHLGSNAFSACQALSSVRVESMPTKLGYTPFADCPAISRFFLSNTGHKSHIYHWFSSSKDAFDRQMTKLTHVTVEALRPGEFEGYRSLRSVEVLAARSIPERAFAECERLEHVSITKPLIHVGDRAFFNCRKLTELQLQFVGSTVGNRAFYHCDRLAVDKRFDSADYIGDRAFAYTDLTSFSFEKRRRYIGTFAFANARFPKDLTLDLTGCTVYPGAFHGVESIDSLRMDSLHTLYRKSLHYLFEAANDTFSKKISIRHLSVSGTVPPEAFRGLTNLKSVEFHADSGRIPAGVFMDCTSVEWVKVAGQVRRIEASAFENCQNLSRLDISLNAAHLEERAFFGCPHASRLVHLPNVIALGAHALAETDLVHPQLSQETEEIGKGAFARCHKLESMTLPFVGCRPNDPEARLSDLFADADPSATVTVPSKLKKLIVLSSELPTHAFDACPSLTTLELPRIVSFDKEYFSDCPTLATVFLGDSLKNFSAAVLHGCPESVKLSFKPSHPRFKMVGKSIFSKDGSVLYYLAPSSSFEEISEKLRAVAPFAVTYTGESLTVTKNITHLFAHAIDCAHVKHLTVEGVRNIEPSAFYHCDGLQSLSISDAVPSDAFESENELVLETLYLARIGQVPLPSLFSSDSPVSVKNLTLAQSPIPSDRFFASVKEIDHLILEHILPPAHSGLRGKPLHRLTAIGLPCPVAELFGRTPCELSELVLEKCRVHRREFEGITAKAIMLDNISRIDGAAFFGSNIRDLTIRRVDDIDAAAFSHAALQSIALTSDTLRVIDGVLYNQNTLVHCFDREVTDFTVPTFVERIAAGAFEDLPSLSHLAISHPHVTLEPRCIVNCPALHTLELYQPNLLSLKEAMDDPSTVLSVRYKGEELKRKWFSHLKKLREVTLLGVKRIGDMAFAHCDKLGKIVGLESVQQLGDMVFFRCSSLMEVALSPQCLRVGLGAFLGCHSLRKAAYPIDRFQHQYRLQAVDLFGTDDRIPLTVDINGGDLPADYFHDFSVSVTVSGAPTRIGDRALKDVDLVSANLRQVRELGDEALMGTWLNTVDLSSAVRVGDRALAECYSLDQVVLGNRLESLGEDWVRNAPISQLTGAPNGFRYQTVNNCLVDKKTSTLLYVAPQDARRMIAPPPSAKTIAPGVLHNSHATAMDLRYITALREGELEGCLDLSTLTLPFLGETLDCPQPLSYLLGTPSPMLSLSAVTVLGGKLADSSFEGFSTLQMVEIPPHAAISDSCFRGCTRLQTVKNHETAPSVGNGAFDSCVALAKLNPTCATFVGDRAFAHCSALDELRLCALTKHLGTQILDGCHHVKHVSLAFTPEVCRISQLGDSVSASLQSVSLLGTHMGDNAFEHCENLNRVILHPDTDHIPASAFADCHSLKELRPPRQLASLGPRAFLRCLSLSSVGSLESLRTVGASAFEESGLRGELHLEQINHLGDSSFAGCGLHRITLSPMLKSIPEQAFANCVALTHVQGSEQLTRIESEAFLNCKALSHIRTDRVESIGARAFEGCFALAAIHLPALTKLCDGAFRNCHSLSKVTLGKDLMQIPAYAFSGCSSLADVNIPPHTRSIGSYAFERASMKGRVLTVPHTVSHVGEQLFRYADAPTVSVCRGQTNHWNAKWRVGCNRHGLFGLRSKVPVKKRSGHRK